MGILDLDSDATDRLLGLASGLLSVSGPSTTPVSFGQALGAGTQGMQQSNQRALQRKMLESQLATGELQRKQLESQAARNDQWRSMWGGGGAGQGYGKPLDQSAMMNPMTGGIPNAPTAASAAPNSAIPSHLQQFAPYLAAMGAEDGSKFLAQVQAKQMETGQWENANVDGMPGQKNRLTGEFKPFAAGTLPDQWERVTEGGVQMQRNKRTGELKPVDPTLAKVQMGVTLPPQEDEFNKVVGKSLGGTYSDLMNAEMQSGTKLGKLNRLDSLLNQTYTGTGAEAALGATKALKAAGDAFGVDTSGLSERAAPAEAAQALAREMALELRNPAGGAGMPGALSDADRRFLESMVPGLSQTPEGRKAIIETNKRVIQRQTEVAKLAREYRKKNGKFDEGFYDELAKYSAANPLFAGLKVPDAAPATTAPPPGAVTIRGMTIVPVR